MGRQQGKEKKKKEKTDRCRHGSSRLIRFMSVGTLVLICLFLFTSFMRREQELTTSVSLYSSMFCKISFAVSTLHQMLAELLCTWITLLFTWHKQLFITKSCYLWSNLSFFISKWETFSHKSPKSRSPVRSIFPQH